MRSANRITTVNGHQGGELRLTEAALKADVRRLRLENKLKGLQMRRKLLEDFSSGDWTDVVSDYLGFYRDNLQGWVPLANVNDRKAGSNFPMWYSEAQLNLLRQPARILCATNNYAIGLINGLTSYVVGTGYTFRAVAKQDDDVPDDVAPGDRPGATDKGLKRLVKAAQAVIDRFVDDNAYDELQGELFWRTREDGEAFIRIFTEEDFHRTTLRTVEPEQITQPPAGLWDIWSYGIRTALDDVQRPLEYYARYLYQAAEGDYVDAADIVHIPVNNKRSIKRGVTDFAWTTYKAMTQAEKLRENMTVGASIQAAIALIRQHETATQQQIQTFVETMADDTRTDPATNRSYPTRRYDAGLEINIPKGQEFVPPPGAAAGESHAAVLQVALRAAGLRWNAPEWLSSGLHDTSSFASSLTAESPFVKYCERAQGFYKRRFQIPVRRALQDAIDWGELPEDLWEHVELTCETPSVQARNALDEAQTDQIYVGIGAKSPQIVADEQGYDYDQVQQQNAEHREANEPAGLGLQLPGQEGQGPEGERAPAGGNVGTSKG